MRNKFRQSIQRCQWMLNGSSIEILLITELTPAPTLSFVVSRLVFQIARPLTCSSVDSYAQLLKGIHQNWTSCLVHVKTQNAQTFKNAFSPFFHIGSICNTFKTSFSMWKTLENILFKGLVYFVTVFLVLIDSSIDCLIGYTFLIQNDFLFCWCRHQRSAGTNAKENLCRNPSTGVFFIGGRYSVHRDNKN